MAIDWLSAEAPFPFVWWDVAAVCLFSALPLAFALALAIRRRVSALASLVVAAVAAVAGAGVFAGVASADLANMAPGLLAGGGLARRLIPLGLAVAAALGCLAIRPSSSTASAGILMFRALVLLVLPTIYVQARCQHDAARASSLVEQSRLGEARAILQRLVALSPRAAWKGQPLRELLVQLQPAIREIQSRVAAPLPPDATDEQRIERARELAVLGREQEAIEVLQASPRVRTSGEGLNLMGTIYESRGEFRAGLDSYRQGREAWEEQPPSSERTQGLIQAHRGVGYCARKVGRYAEAEAAYLSVLEISPTAETHFLVAQFYADIEHTKKAQLHAQQAMNLASDRYQAEGKKLLDQLMMRHFGCFGVFRDSGGGR